MENFRKGGTQMTGVLFFEDNKGNMRLVNSTVSEDNIYPEIVKYIKKLNPNFHIHYIRTWAIDNDITQFDIGSHTEFFFFTKNKERFFSKWQNNRKRADSN